MNCVTESFPGRGNTGSRGCGGGSAYGAYAHSHVAGAVDSSCLPYTAQTQNCTAQHVCEQHLSSRGHPVAVTPLRYFVAEYGAVGVVSPASNPGPVTPVPPGNELAMQKEIYARGPISCCMACPDEFEEEYTGGVYVTANNRVSTHSPPPTHMYALYTYMRFCPGSVQNSNPLAIVTLPLLQRVSVIVIVPFSAVQTAPAWLHRAKPLRDV